MPLHHRPEICNMRSAYSRSVSSGQSVSSESDRSEQTGSVRSYTTRPTINPSRADQRQHPAHHHVVEQRAGRGEHPRSMQESVWEGPRQSEESVASTVLSEQDLQDRRSEEEADYDLPDYTAIPYESRVVPATPADFSKLFPSHRRMTVRHDDTTLDGNMNLRVDTEVVVHDRKCDMTLFHLRMHDLKHRDFSLRRYCRDSGREVCHSDRRPAKPNDEDRTRLRRSFSNALRSVSGRSRSESRAAAMRGLKRNDSGYASLHSVDLHELDRPQSACGGAVDQLQNSTVRLEFSNYAHMDIKRTGSKSKKRYDFEYWGVRYSWRRIARKDGPCKGFTYQLTKPGSDNAVAYIMPLALTPLQLQEEQAKGGWIPPCSMWLADECVIQGQKDVGDAIIASGLIALVDDAIRTRFDAANDTHVTIPLPKKQVSVDYVGPRRLISDMLRRDSTGSERTRSSTTRRWSTSSRPSMSSRPSSRSTAGAVWPAGYQ